MNSKKEGNMHIPDGFLDAKTFSAFGFISALGVGIAIKNTHKKLGEKQVPMVGVLAAFIFAAQMLNFPVAGGTSGHFVGGTLAAILLGPSAGILIMSTILIIQCLIFQDGGLTALGANIFNMGIIGAAVGYYIYRILKTLIRNTFISAFISGWISVVLGASFCAIELSISNTCPLKVALPAMASIHALIGIGEGLITAFVLSFISKVRPDLLELYKTQ
jgi:cobalt/nickel transport system permease protein